MKKLHILLLVLLTISLIGCGNNNSNLNQMQYYDTSIGENIDINNVIKTIIKNHTSDGDNGELFVDIAVLGNSINDNGNTEYYLIADGQGFKVDERGNLSNTSGFGNVPTVIELSKNENGYNLIRYETAKDGSEYDSSTKEIFSKDAYKVRKDAKYAFINKKSLLKQAEEYFGVTIIPEPKNNFECTFCDKLRYYNRTPETDEKLNQTNDLYFDYITTDNGQNTIYFNSDGSFEAKGSRDAGTGTRTFGQNENTIIVLNNSIDHVYDRYIIRNQNEDSLDTILEIIQRR